MLKVEALLGIVVLALWIYCVIDLIQTRDDDVRSLPKIAWVLIVLLFPLVGSIAWLAVGRPQPGPRPGPGRGAGGSFPEHDRPGRMTATSPDDDEDFLRQVRERAEEQRRRYREAKGEPADPSPEEPTGESPAEPTEG